MSLLNARDYFIGNLLGRAPGGQQAGDTELRCCWNGAELLLEQSPQCCVRQPQLLLCVCSGHSSAHRGSPVPSQGLYQITKQIGTSTLPCDFYHPMLLWSARLVQLEDIVKARYFVCVMLKMANRRPGVGEGGWKGRAS